MNRFLFLSILWAPLIVGCVDLNDPTPKRPITLTSSPAEITADGSSRVYLTAVLSEDVDPNKDITFTTDWGVFAGVPPTDAEKLSTITVKASGRKAHVMLIADTSRHSFAYVYATVDRFPDTAAIPIRPAFPDSIGATLDKGTIKADQTESATLTVYLYRNPGFATRRHPVSFHVYPDSLAIVTPPTALSAERTATAMVRSAGNDTGKVLIVTTSMVEPGKTINDTVHLKLLP